MSDFPRKLAIAFGVKLALIAAVVAYLVIEFG